MMRNEVLHGYLIHHRKYREKSHIVHLYTQEYGRVDGIIRQIPPPQYQPIRLQASGKSELKNFTKLEILNQPVFFHGDAFFAGFYLLNKLFTKLVHVSLFQIRLGVLSTNFPLKLKLKKMNCHSIYNCILLFIVLRKVCVFLFLIPKDDENKNFQLE